ncbi:MULTISPECIES: glycosyltransferase family 4 protein [Bradyrhizobium]|uniref:Glycosyltransferase family 4 protein n=1 Tax=Bradyrhizobium brasilense TaxID=1419277 RepID=A0ABY8JMQ8_9BRAD|nr:MULTISPECIES: glycosyltransferase family 4 protein [Bradyrhizobium]WFU66924.1 glycosyltransferase family 4 protein [Bradyrhizobium brasilense]
MSSFLQNRPFYGGNPNRKSEPKFLLVAFFDPHGINTVGEQIASWQSFTRFDFHLLNLWPNAGGGSLTIPDTVDLNAYDGVILHNTTAYFPANLFNLDSRLSVKFRDYDGVKVLAKQDEHYHSARWSEFIRDNGFNVLITCVPPAEIEKVYSRSTVGNISVVHALTGFVSPFLRSLSSPPLAGRTIDIGYRGSVQPLSFGRLGFEKRKIGFDVARAVSGSNRKIDISSRWEDRISGENWFKFMANSRVILGVESGSNLFDFNGGVERWCQGYANLNVESQESEQYYLRAHDLFLHKYEGNVDYAQISPRHFEAAATRSVQLLYEGRYSEIFVPGRHYVSLKRDLSNLEEALEIIGNDSRAKQLTDAAFDEIVMNDNLSYARFVEKVDIALEQELNERPSRRQAASSAGSEAPAWAASKTVRRRALMVMAHEPSVDPRIDWFCTGLTSRDYDVIELGIKSATKSGPAIEDLGRGRTRVRVERSSHADDAVSNPVQFGSEGDHFPEHVLLMLRGYSKMDRATLAERLGAFETTTEIDRFTWYCAYFYDVNCSLLRAARAIGTYDVVVAADLDALPAALILARESNAVCVYDSHEYWKGNFIDSTWAFEFWGSIERRLVGLADVCCTVSPPLADQLELEYGKPFAAVPNCELVSAAAGIGKRFLDRSDLKPGSVVFLFQGNFHPERPVRKLIDAWPRTDQNAILWLRGPHWSYRDELIEIARGTGLLGTRIFFPDAVAEDDLVAAAAEADVGIIPYDPSVHLGYKFACPNKLSQYLAAGLAILTSELEYVRSIVTENDFGRVFDLRDMASLVKEVNALARNPDSLKERRGASREYFLAKFNWEATSKIVYDQMAAALDRHDANGLRNNSPLRFDRVVERKPAVQSSYATAIVELVQQSSGATGVAELATKYGKPLWRLTPAVIQTQLRPVVQACLRRLGR